MGGSVGSTGGTILTGHAWAEAVTVSFVGHVLFCFVVEESVVGRWPGHLLHVAESGYRHGACSHGRPLHVHEQMLVGSLQPECGKGPVMSE